MSQQDALEKQRDLEDLISRLYAIVFSMYQNDIIEPYYLQKHLAYASYVLPENAPPTVRHAAAAATEAGIKQAAFFLVPSDYYQRPLLVRANLLMAPSTDHLCKSLVFENTRCADGEPRFYMVVVQYTTKLDTEVLGRFVQSLRTQRLGNKYYNMRLAAPEDSLRLTGYENNAVCPFGCTEIMPVIVSQAILALKPRVLFLGAGHTDWKVMVRIEELLAATKALIADVSI